MKWFALATVLFATNVAHARPQSSISLGPVLSLPEIFGGYLSYWADDDVTIDLRATLSSVEGGLTGHVALSNHDGVRHDVLFTGMGGFVHRGVRAGSYTDSGYGAGGRVIGAAGYGFQGERIDLRVEGGLSAYQATDWHLDPTFWISLGFFI